MRHQLAIKKAFLRLTCIHEGLTYFQSQDFFRRVSSQIGQNKPMGSVEGIFISGFIRRAYQQGLGQMPIQKRQQGQRVQQRGPIQRSTIEELMILGPQQLSLVKGLTEGLVSEASLLSLIIEASSLKPPHRSLVIEASSLNPHYCSFLIEASSLKLPHWSLLIETSSLKPSY